MSGFAIFSLKNLSADELYRQRQEKAKPLLDKFRQWLSNRSLQTPPKRLLGKAMSHTLKQWNRLIGYLEDGDLSPDNNAAENSIRPFVVEKKLVVFRHH